MGIKKKGAGEEHSLTSELAFPVLAVASSACAEDSIAFDEKAKRITMREEGRPSWAGGPKGLDLISGDCP